ncbi:MAG: alkaline phosphatase family protein [Mycobacteriales bacterium]
MLFGLSSAAVLSVAIAAFAAGDLTGRLGPVVSTNANGRHRTPAGRMTTVGNFPSGSALTPDGTALWAVDSGHGRDDVQVVDVASGRVRQVLPLPGAYGAIAFAPDGRTAYVSGEPLGSSHPQGKTVANNGDAVHVFRLDRDGTATEVAPIRLPVTSGGSAQQEDANPASIVFTPPGPGPSSGLGWPIGLAVSPNQRTLTVALNQADQVAIVDLRTHTVRLVKVGKYPYGVVSDDRTAWVGNEYDGTISSVDLKSGTVAMTTGVGGQNAHPEGLLLSGSDLYVAVTNRDRVVRMSTRTRRVTAAWSVGRAAGVGTAPVALAVGGTRLYVADAGEDAVAVLDYRTGRMLGRIPTAAYPTGIAVSRTGSVVWTAAKGLGAGPNPTYGQHFADSEAAPYGSYVPDMLLGRVGVLPVPTPGQLRKYTSQSDAQVRPADLGPASIDTAVQGAGGGPSQQIKHVFYVVRENRTYDQIFGRERRGDGDPALELFGDNGTAGPSGGITPNAHALARRFPLLDHVYADSEVSIDGHVITSGAYATDFDLRSLHANYSGRGRVANLGQSPVTLPPNDFLFDQAVRQGISFRNYGEYSAGNLPAGNDGRSTYRQSAAGTATGYPLFFGCEAAPNAVDRDAVCASDSGTLGAPLRPASSRFDFFQSQFRAQLSAGAVPALTYLTLPNDHTDGVKRGYPTPSALVADNDLGLGQLVDLISHSSIWSSSAIFVVEDDTQDGADHVDAHRMPAFLISPWTKTGAVVHTRYDQLSAIRTIELMLGLHPLSLGDGLAEPMYDAFRPTSTGPDLRPYNAIAPAHDLTDVNLTTVPGLEGQLPYEERDLVPQALFDAALWHAVYGPQAVPPPPGAGSSPAEHERATRTRQAWLLGIDPGQWLRSSASRRNDSDR